MKATTTTHRAQAIDPQRFRNLATGIGQSASESERTGAHRAQCVIDATPAAQRKHAGPSYPAPTPENVPPCYCR